MNRLLVEIKAHCSNPEQIRQLLLSAGADFRGTDHQIDTYFKVSDGRLKLRRGNIEKSLIHYRREDQAGPKDSHVNLCRMEEIPENLRSVLASALGVWVEVDKQRDIYFIDNVKFHLDQVVGLGSFVEIEAIGQPGIDAQPKLLAQCQHYLKLFGIEPEQLVANSYSDLLSEHLALSKNPAS